MEKTYGRYPANSDNLLAQCILPVTLRASHSFSVKFTHLTPLLCSVLLTNLILHTHSHTVMCPHAFLTLGTLHRLSVKWRRTLTITVTS